MRFIKIKNLKTTELSLEELCEISSAKYNPLKDNEDYNCIELEHINQNDGTINGFVSAREQSSIKNKFDDQSVLFGKLRPYLRKFYKPNYTGVCSSEIWALRPKANVSRDYLFYLIQSNKFLNIANISCGSKMPRADWDYMKQFTFVIPEISEQNKIATFLNLYYKKIELQKKKIELLKLLLKQKIDDSFKQLHDSYKIKLSHLITQISERNKNNLDMPVLSVSNKSGFVPQSEQFEEEVASEDKSGYKVIMSNQFAYNPARINVGSIARLKGKYEFGQISPMYVCFECCGKINNDYFEYYLKSQIFKREMLKRLEGSVRMCLSYESLCNIKIQLPSMDEQKELVDRLSILDKKIKFEEQKLIFIENYKQGLLQQMFI